MLESRKQGYSLTRGKRVEKQLLFPYPGKAQACYCRSVRVVNQGGNWPFTSAPVCILFFFSFFILKPSLSPGHKTTALPLQPIFRTLPHAASTALPLAGVHHFHQFTCCLHQVVEEESHLPTCNVPSRPALQLRIHRDQSGDIHGADTDACQDAIRQTTTT